MIIPRLYGRLGNQAFQISAAIAHAKKMQTNWAIPRATNDTRIWPNYFIKQVPRGNITFYGTRSHYDEPRHCYNALPETQDLTINGYFQSEKYFLDAKEDIGNALGFHCNKQDYIAVHVRRGDYVSQFSDKHPPLDDFYYHNAIMTFANYDIKSFKFYSDDIDYCRKKYDEIKFRLGINVEYSNIKDPLTDMRDMYNAAGFIIANSTFSLFPALLRLDNPVVIAPAENRWYGPGNSHLETFDLMPERFIKI